LIFQVVAIAGGVTYKDGQGMEFWNPEDGSVTVVVDQLPTEIGSLTPLQVFFILKLLKLLMLIIFCCSFLLHVFSAAGGYERFAVAGVVNAADHSIGVAVFFAAVGTYKSKGSRYCTGLD